MSGHEDDPEIAYHADALASALGMMRQSVRSIAVLARAIDGYFDETVNRSAEGEAVAGYLPPEGSYGYVAYEIPAFLRALDGLDRALAADPDHAVAGARYRPVNFLEVGCGSGRNLFLIRHGAPILWSELTGIEIARPMVEAGARLFGLDDMLICADAMDFDYSPYDVVFSYRPFMDDEKQIAYEAHLARSMKVSAYLLSPMAINRTRSHRWLAVGDSGDLWKKIG